MSAIRIRALDHVVLRVSDVARSLRFYCDVLGCSEERRIIEPGNRFPCNVGGIEHLDAYPKGPPFPLPQRAVPAAHAAARFAPAAVCR